MQQIQHNVAARIDRPDVVDMSRFGVPLFDDVVYDEDRIESCSIAMVRRSSGYSVTTFKRLVELVAEIGYYNHSFNLLFRGQRRDYRNKDERSKILPAIFRSKPGQTKLMKPTLDARVKALHESIDILKDNLRNVLGRHGPHPSLHREFYIALLQHYKLRKTHLIDASHSLRVAASFALLDNQSEGVLYVFGLGHPQGSISHFIDSDIVLVKLQNVAPPEALRPHYQDGYLFGRLSFEGERSYDDAAYRLIAKFRLDNSNGSFWTSEFDPIPKEALLPSVDPFKDRLYELLGEDPVE